MLHHDKQMFEQMILRTSSYLGVKAEIVEKDYFVMLFLKKLTEIMPEIVFKGGPRFLNAITLYSDFPRILI